jgi:hypothetical protein
LYQNEAKKWILKKLFKFDGNHDRTLHPSPPLNEIYLNMSEGHSLHKFKHIEITENSSPNPLTYELAFSETIESYKTDFWSHAVFPNGSIALLCYDGQVKIFPPGGTQESYLPIKCLSDEVTLENGGVVVVSHDRNELYMRKEEYESIQVVQS